MKLIIEKENCRREVANSADFADFNEIRTSNLLNLRVFSISKKTQMSAFDDLSKEEQKTPLFNFSPVED